MRRWAAIEKDLVSECTQFSEQAARFLETISAMKIALRRVVPAGWIVLPVFLAAAVPVLVATLSDSWLFGLAAAIPTAAFATLWIERHLRSVVDAITLIAGGDRYAAMPERIGGGAMADIAAAAERMRQSLIDADAVAVDQRSREA